MKNKSIEKSRRESGDSKENVSTNIMETNEEENEGKSKRQEEGHPHRKGEQEAHPEHRHIHHHHQETEEENRADLNQMVRDFAVKDLTDELVSDLKGNKPEKNKVLPLAHKKAVEIEKGKS